jgi:hypothetical protein
VIVSLLTVSLIANCFEIVLPGTPAAELFQRSVTEATRKLSRDPNQPKVLVERATMFYVLGKTEAAFDDAQASLAQGPQTVESLLIARND